MKTRIKEPVKIRAKKLANGNTSLILDTYVNGERKREYLKLYLIPEKTKADKLKNEQTLEIAKAVQAKRVLELKNQGQGFFDKNIHSNASLIHYIDKIADFYLQKSGKKSGNYYNFKSLNFHLQAFRGDITFKQVDLNFIKEFTTYLSGAKSGNKPKKGTAPKLSPNTQHKLFHKLNQALKKAVKENLLTTNPIDNLGIDEKPKQIESKKEFLTLTELKKLINTECKKENVKQAFIFSCLSGLRFGDVKKMVWGDVSSENGNTKIQYRMQKTKKILYLPISKEAEKWLPERDGDLVFNLGKNDNENSTIAKWVKDAGINKKITYHCSRHTNATLNLTLGAPIEVVSKLLGHTKISTTQIYAQIVGEVQREAVSKQDGIFG